MTYNEKTIIGFIYSQTDEVIAYKIKMASMGRKDKLNEMDYTIGLLLANKYDIKDDESRTECLRMAKQDFAKPLTDIADLPKAKFSFRRLYERIFLL